MYTSVISALRKIVQSHTFMHLRREEMGFRVAPEKTEGPTTSVASWGGTRHGIDGIETATEEVVITWSVHSNLDSNPNTPNKNRRPGLITFQAWLR